MKALFALCSALALISCSTPRPFVPGATVDPPRGCIEQRARDPKAEC